MTGRLKPSTKLSKPMRRCSDCSGDIPDTRKLNYCTACATIRKRVWRAKNRDQDKDTARRWRTLNTEKVATYRERSRDQRNTNSAKWNSDHRQLVNQRQRKRRTDDLQKHMWKAAKSRATTKNIPFNITVEDIGLIPETCPILGIELKSGARGSVNSPSLDRRIPSLGYVKGNVWVISSPIQSKGQKLLKNSGMTTKVFIRGFRIFKQLFHPWRVSNNLHRGNRP